VVDHRESNIWLIKILYWFLHLLKIQSLYLKDVGLPHIVHVAWRSIQDNGMRGGWGIYQPRPVHAWLYGRSKRNSFDLSKDPVEWAQCGVMH
jgi:hypothetical protein